ncbi:MAG: 1-acyl-sn-glycerol-3-phosphate acyltransferase [Acidimicrobiia bacterium]|nr:1-acyl-sn-glycerol-3-phosphate acyltransferase [Acidimicrobiia bacterium]
MIVDSTPVRRLVTVPAVFVTLVVVSVLMPLLIVVALVVDLIRWSRDQRPFMAVRLLGFGWVYLLGEAWALITVGLVGMAGKRFSVEATFTLQRLWTGWNLAALRLFFGLSFVVTGSESVPPGPILLLSRHASMIDTMLPAAYVVRPFRIRLRYVLKRELLLDPALDIGGHRLPNYFVDRRSDDPSAEIEAISTLASDLGPDEGVLIYPEGTRFSEEKRIRYVERLQTNPGPLAEIASTYRRVLPPRPGGTLALLEASSADVVVLMHRGLEGFARVADIWDGGLVGSTIDVHFARVDRSQIPDDPDDRARWLFELWTAVDDWVTGPADHS